MNAQHTNSLLAVNPLLLDQIATADGKFEVARATVLNPIAHTIGNARRLAACWNACTGIPTDMLEAMPEGTAALLPMYAQLEAQRDTLLAALRRLESAAQCRDNTMGDQCRLIEVKAELANAAKNAREAIKQVEAAL